MGTPILFVVIFLLQSVLSFTTDDTYDNFDVLGGSMDDPEVDMYNDRKTRSDKFLRFGKRFWDYETSNDVPYDDSDAPRPPRTGRQEKHDQFIRFGRSNLDLMRFPGNPQQRAPRDKAGFLRFGRSINEDSKKKREKRAAAGAASSTENLKRHENFLRFGRNSNFMRFGRTPPQSYVRAIPHGHVPDEYLMRQIMESRSDPFTIYLRNLVQQPDEKMSEI